MEIILLIAFGFIGGFGVSQEFVQKPPINVIIQEAPKDVPICTMSAIGRNK